MTRPEAGAVHDESVPALLPLEHDKGGAVTDRDARNPAFRHERRRTPHEGRLETARVLERPSHDGRSPGLQRVVRAIETKHTEGSEKFGKGGAAGRREGRLGPEVCPQPLEHLGVPFEGGEVRGQRGQRRFNSGAERLAGHRPKRGLGRSIRQGLDVEGAVRAEPRGVIGLGEVVVVSRDPEERDHGAMPPSGQHLGERGGRQRLVDRVERPREERGLLPCSDDEHAGLGEARAQRGLPGARDDGGQERGVEPARQGRRPGGARGEGRRDDAHQEVRRESMMARAAPATRGPPS